jgi:ABC-2 type transport system ATP-binding protein
MAIDSSGNGPAPRGRYAAAPPGFHPDARSVVAPLLARSLTKKIGRRTIVDSVNLELRAGEIFGFLGPNGAGKTTTIRMLVGLIRPDSGSVEICGHDIDREFERAMRCVGCIVETPDLYRFLTGRENLEHFARMLGEVDEAQIDAISERVALSHRLDDRVSTYSLGMRQRLGIAQALLGEPRVLILDEPANGLDPAGIREMRHLLRSLADSGMTIFVSSHLLAEIELMCDRVAIIHRGRILTTSSVAELTSRDVDVEIRVDDAGRAGSIAREAGFEAVVEGNRLIARAASARSAELIAALVRGGIRVDEARRRDRTLEESFLEATAGETVTD